MLLVGIAQYCCDLRGSPNAQKCAIPSLVILRREFGWKIQPTVGSIHQSLPILCISQYSYIRRLRWTNDTQESVSAATKLAWPFLLSLRNKRFNMFCLAAPLCIAIFLCRDRNTDRATPTALSAWQKHSNEIDQRPYILLAGHWIRLIK